MYAGDAVAARNLKNKVVSRFHSDSGLYYSFTGDKVTRCNDCTDYILPLRPGDRVSVVEECSKGYFVKHNGISGWYYGRLK